MPERYFSKAESELLREIMVSRRDVRGNRFLPDSIPSEAIDKILFAGISAPSVGFSQPWEFVLITNNEIKYQIKNSFEEENSSASRLFEKEQKDKYDKLKLEGILDSPLNIAVFYRPSDKIVLGQTSMSEVGLYSVVCAVQNMWLMARSLNIGVGWVSILNPDKVKKILDAPNESKLVAYLCLGYVTEFLDRPELEILDWEKRKESGSLIHYERYQKDGK